MTEAEAIVKAKAFLGIAGEPARARLVRGSHRPYWSIVFMQDALFPKETARGDIIDGPMVLYVDDASGEVEVLM